MPLPADPDEAPPQPGGRGLPPPSLPGRGWRAGTTRPEAPDHRLEQDLAYALEQGQLTLHYQPRVRLTTRLPIGAEALARWPHRRRGMVPPVVFIPMAERMGLITQLGGWALSTACIEATRWPAPAVVSVNVSALQLAEGCLLRQVRAALDESGLAPERLEIELTESMLVDAGIETLLTLSAVRDLGVGIALDDFGTGYASLAALKRLPLTQLKLDRSLIRGVPRHREDSAIAGALVATGHALDLSIVAEGVECEAQCRFLCEIGCEQGQSFFLGHPVPAERLRQNLIGAIG
ncbi:MAG: EAL domain-containing protein [Acidisphaera sp.]|nr:EAL domain-containing protein [Acidisphaera sp.]